MDSDLEKFSEQNGMKTLGTNAMDPGKQYECLSSPREQMKSNTWEVQISDKSGILKQCSDISKLENIP